MKIVRTPLAVAAALAAGVVWAITGDGLGRSDHPVSSVQPLSAFAPGGVRIQSEEVDVSHRKSPFGF